ncbi:MAG: hypothetical protein HY690_02900 [Chloroflexi bacterium]|nr:hypothetical protein [Chloroflexota bacterium]
MRMLRPLVVLAMLPLLAACGAPASEPTPQAEPTEAAPPTPQPAPALFRPITPEPAEGSPSPAALPQATPSPGALAAQRTPAPTLAPVATPVPALSQRAQHEGTELSKHLDELMLALRRRNSSDLVRAQQGLREALDRTEAGLKGDNSPKAKVLAGAVADVRGGLSGDLPKLESAQKTLREAVGPAPTASGTPGPAATPSVEPIVDLERFAQKLSKDLAAFQEALAQRDPGRILSLQSQLLDAVAQADLSLEGDSSPQAEKLRAASGAVRAALNGDQPKFRDAARLLSEVSGQEVAGAQATPAAKPKADLGVVAQNLDNQLAGLRDLAANPGNSPDELARRRKDLDKEIAQAEQALAGETSPGAQLLRQAVGAVQEVAAGDATKLERARTLLRQAREAS